MKKILLIILLLAQPIYAESNGMSKLLIPACDYLRLCYDPYPLQPGMDLEREIAEFEAKLAKDHSLIKPPKK